MITTVNDIFREIQPEGHSMSLARRCLATEVVKFNGELVTSMCQELDVQIGSTFQIGKSVWTSEGESWVLSQGIGYGSQQKD